MCTVCSHLSANLQDCWTVPVLKTSKSWNDMTAYHHHINNFKKIKNNTSLNFNNVTYLLFFFPIPYKCIPVTNGKFPYLAISIIKSYICKYIIISKQYPLFCIIDSKICKVLLKYSTLPIHRISIEHSISQKRILIAYDSC